MRKLSSRQSKLGCFNCRSRRVKCDEAKPECNRCKSSGRTCEGFPSNAPVSSSSSTNLSTMPQFGEEYPSEDVSPMLQLSPWGNAVAERVRLIRLGSHVLAWDPSGIRTSLETTLWSRLLPQLSQAITLVGSAVAAFGAAYEDRFLRQGTCRSTVAVAKHYTRTIENLSRHLKSQPDGIFPLILTCTLLAAMEAIRRHQGDALTHAEGAFRLLDTYYFHNHAGIDAHSIASADHSHMLDSEDDPTFTICFNLDLMITTYARSRAPTLNTTAPSLLEITFSSIEQAGTLLKKIMHSCLNFASKASRFRYQPRTKSPPEFAIEQGRHVSSLLRWLESFQPFLRLGLAEPSHRAGTKSAFKLEAQCLMAMVHISTIYSPHETTYDSYTAEFQRIVHCAEVTLNPKDLESSILTPFSPTPGIVMPLCFTAVRCRHPAVRRRAISLLQIAGVEGPWNGRIEAAIATKIVQIEERRPVDDSGLEPPMLSKPSEVHERNRVCHYIILDESCDDRSLVHRMTIQLAQCLDVERMISCDSGHADSPYWKVWQQELEIG